MKTCLLAAIVAILATELQAEPPPGYKLVWSEEFNGTTADLDKHWMFQNGPSGHILCSRWRENVVVANGVCRLENRKEKRGGQDWTSGSLWTKREFQYGYFECRYRYAAATGTNNSFWLMSTGQVSDGKKRFEIDINEGHFPSEVATNIHNHSNVTVVNGKRTHPTSSRKYPFDAKHGNYNFARDFHVFGLEWTQQALVFYVDGKEIRRETNVFCHSPASVWLSEAIISWAGKVADTIDGTAMEVDYVRVYQKEP
jgi:beta-glucanase (GH16 family)